MQVRVLQAENEVYQREKLLGEGAFGKAYLVRQKTTGELLVIKEVSMEHMGKKEQEETIKEAQILRNLKHPLIVRFVEVYATKQNKLKIVMEYAECGDLSRAIANKRSSKGIFEESQILDWFTQLCLAMKHVHDRKILHRDIKGQNIFITKANTLKLGDFGIARVLAKTQEKARTVVGTPYYLSPEIIENKPYSFKSDIWSMGVLLYELCALSPPFNANSLQMLALKIVKGSYTPITTPYSKELKGLIADILQVDPNRRPMMREILERPFIKERIRKFLSETSHKIEFSHTILHNQRVEIANKVIRMPDQVQQSEQERAKLKEQAQILQQKIDQKKKDDAKERDELLRKKEDERFRKEQELQRKKEQEQKARDQEKRRFAERKQWAEREKAKEDERMRNQQEAERKRVFEIAEMGRKRERDEQESYQRRQAPRQAQTPKRFNRDDIKKVEEQKKIDEINEFARKQWYENQMIRKKAEERAKQSEMEGYNEVPQHQQEPQTKSRPQSIKQEQTKILRESKEKKPQIQQPIVQKRNSNASQPTPEEIQNALLNPNFRRPTAQGKSSEPKVTESPSQWKSRVKEEVEEKGRKDYSEQREQIKKDREEYLRAQKAPAEEQKPVETLKPGKWDKRPKSREGKQQAKEQGLLGIRDEQQLQAYLIQLEGLLGDVQKRIEKLQPFADLPEDEEIIFRDDDHQQLQYSITGSFEIKAPCEDQADFDLFSDYSKLEELRINLEDKFGTDQFIQIYRILEGELQTRGLENFNILELEGRMGQHVEKKLILDNLPLLLTLIVMEQKMSY